MDRTAIREGAVRIAVGSAWARAYGVPTDRPEADHAMRGPSLCTFRERDQAAICDRDDFITHHNATLQEALHGCVARDGCQAVEVKHSCMPPMWPGPETVFQSQGRRNPRHLKMASAHAKIYREVGTTQWHKHLQTPRPHLPALRMTKCARRSLSAS